SDMLKRLHALPTGSLLELHATSGDEQAFLNERSYAFAMSVDAYRKEVAERQQLQCTIDFARWLASQMNTRPDEFAGHSAEEIIASAMLLWHAGQGAGALPGKAAFVQLLTALRKPSFRPQPDAWQSVLPLVPEAFHPMAAAMMAQFEREKLPLLRDKSIKPDAFIHGEHAGMFFIRGNLDEDGGEFDKLAYQAWVRITRGKTDPATLATVFLLIASGQQPKSTLLKREGAAIISHFRTHGFESGKVCQFIEEFAPVRQREELKQMWLEDLRDEAEVHLADPYQDDSYMERSLRYLQQTCAASWKGRQS
ncbi:hypothetical protein, partial [Craterilacuibacter sp.]|uniref:hypothetical protein n=1 Tax=Craterilacuibacter sp. TaxID=2870909 RepID=UPI003F2EA123